MELDQRELLRFTSFDAERRVPRWFEVHRSQPNKRPARPLNLSPFFRLDRGCFIQQM